MKPLYARLFTITFAAGCFSSGSHADRLEDGRKAYREVCVQCHESGNRGAPMVSRQEDWEGRSNLWSAVLAEHVAKGFFGMPAKGGAAELDRYEMEAAAEYMLNLTQPDLPSD